ncbi:hypothetical protein O3M35_005313 [Rhynocoris fuscipes]|uniref:NADH dehydrogenase subunit 6 n=1 Tax=Rhynocoris fuscipes TaxID=488301 RepID=A0AAW1DK22_9HEMI
MTYFKIINLLILSVLGALLSITCSVVFTICKNDWAVLWSFLSALYTLMNVYLISLEYAEKLEYYYNLSILKNINCFACISTICYTFALIWYIFEIIYYNMPSLPLNESYPAIAVMCFMTANWAAVLTIITRRQIKMLCNISRYFL